MKFGNRSIFVSTGRPLCIKILSFSPVTFRSQALEFESPCPKDCRRSMKTVCCTALDQLRKTITAKRDMLELSFVINVFKLDFREWIDRLSFSDIDLLKPTGYVMHHQFNIQQLYALPTLYLCVLYLSENKQRLVPLTA